MDFSELLGVCRFTPQEEEKSAKPKYILGCQNLSFAALGNSGEPTVESSRSASRSSKAPKPPVKHIRGYVIKPLNYKGACPLLLDEQNFLKDAENPVNSEFTALEHETMCTPPCVSPWGRWFWDADLFRS